VGLKTENWSGSLGRWPAKGPVWDDPDHWIEDGRLRLKEMEAEK